MDRKFAITGLIYAVLGIVLGIVMAATHNHSQLVTHAHNKKENDGQVV